MALAEPVKIGMITILSGGGSGLGIAMRDGFKLAIDQEGGKLGGYSVELIVCTLLERLSSRDLTN